MNQLPILKVSSLSLLVFLGFLMVGCATTTEEEMASVHEAMPMQGMPMQGEMPMMKTFPEDYVFPLSEINLEKVIEENRGMKILKENATTVRDYYRGGVQEKAEGERLLKEGKWEEGISHFIESTRFLEVVVDYLPEDEPYHNVYGDHYVIYMPNLLIADNQVKVTQLYEKLKMSDDDIYWIRRKGKEYLARSLMSVKTEWAFQIKRELEKE